ncbi:6221_t:CDS:2 [Diversispora eburnea]|uniref:6221_t:CDS:1 n=1 Tax=Diversispora eburnea TaxID=1213867 RepID=A0A9N8V3E6_9GLOM|nr:6221_t:CDS:2 [Diversispora eburnea]
MKSNNIFVSSLCIYPVKSCRGIPLALISPRINELSSELILSAPEVQDLHLPLLPKKEFCKKYQTNLWGDQVIGYCCGDEPDNWLSNFLKVSVGLLFKSNEDTRIIRKNLPKEIDFQPETAFADSYPFLIMSEESLHDLNKRLSEPVAFINFRPNIVVKGCNKSFEEDTWKEIIIGNDKENIFYLACRSTRCTVPNVNPDTGIKNKLEPLKTLSSYRRVDLGSKYHACFGMNEYDS